MVSSPQEIPWVSGTIWLGFKTVGGSLASMQTTPAENQATTKTLGKEEKLG